MNPHNENRDEEQVASFLAATERDVVPPDPDFLARLRVQSTEAFQNAPGCWSSAFRRSEEVAGHRLKAGLQRWFFRSARWIAAAAAILLGVGLCFWLVPGQPANAFGKAIENVESADTLHLRLSLNRGLKHVEVWHSNRPRRSRWDDLAGHYRIADGATYWIVDEKANQARRAEPPAGLSRPIMHILDLLGLPKDRERLLKARPVDRVKDGAVEVLVYQVMLPAPEGEFQIDAVVVAGSHRLHSLTAKLEKDGRIEPIGELTVIACNEPVGAEKFVVADTLTEDGRIGAMTDVQGIVTVKPVMHQRWTPARSHLILKPGDWVRTDARGANATALRLIKQTGVILGPKSLVELIGPKQIRIVEGEIEITAPAKSPVELLGPGQQKVVVRGKKLFRIDKERLVRLPRDPPWLLGFKGVTADESLGSLVANVDGRNVPLTVGYHKVSVDIRDQIARTVVEESFVNHTKTQLEGVFYFPLPQDASISGFGMWIGDNLIEADVVEKQRAREIYETILRERRDPGLLEWSGGNIFKARVFPIPANAEKRIKITYTQVLPLQGSRYRYSYALQSEMLRQHPLRELSLDVKVNSVIPLKSVTSPTHPARTDHTAHSGHVEFTAQEYTPTRDFEVVIEVDGRQADVVMIPHRRGDDGYFMLQLTPPGAQGDWERPLLADGEPVQLLILADTSASIDSGQRATQATFIGALLASLTPKDSFNLATCDVTCDWAFAEPAPADSKRIAAARDFLARRASLGWTNLDLAFAEALKRAGPKTHVVYVGDGIVTTGDADPVAFSHRLRRLYRGSLATFHAVALGNSFEPGVMKTIGSLGGGSLRKISGEQGPQAVARELLGEIAQPALRDLKVEFSGLKVARVYPEVLPNVSAGAQQIILGRYLPEGGDQAGEVVVSGTQAGKSVRFRTRVALKDAEHGNSFIPRLWARMHLDSLLEQGASSAIRDEIIALSEEYQIITPYTSFLVLETDADRERFKVKRRFRMRDGEKFFAQGRDNAVFDLTQKQMKRAGDWRVALRLSVLRQLAQLGRDPRLFQPRPHYRELETRLGRTRTVSEIEGLDFESDGLGDMYALGDGAIHFAGDTPPVAEGGFPAEEWNETGLEEGKSGKDQGLAEDEFRGEAREPLGEPALAGEPLESPPLGLGLSGLGGLVNGELYFDGDVGDPFGFDGSINGKYGGRGYFGRRVWPQYGQWLNTLFPQLRPVPGKAKEPKSTWPAAARDLARSLLRTDKLAKMTGGIEILRRSESFEVRWGETTARSRRFELFSASSWLTRSESDGGQTLISWCDAKEHGVFSKAFQLGRLRASTPRDVQPPPLQLDDYSLTSLERAFPGYVPSLEPQGNDRVLLVLKHASSPAYESRVLIDTGRHVILSIEHRYKGKVTNVSKFDDFVEVAGTWWARRVENTDEKGKRVSLMTQTIRPLTAKELGEQHKKELAGRDQVQFLHLPLPRIWAAKKALSAGKAGFGDHFLLLLHFSRSQQWERVLEHLQEAEKLAAGKPGLRWLRSALLYDSRRHNELKLRYQEDAARLAKAPAGVADDFFLGEYIVGQSPRILEANEMLSLLKVVEPLYQRQPAHVHGPKRWQTLRVSYLRQAGQLDLALGLQKQVAAGYPHDYYLQREYARALADAGDYPAAYAWLTRVLVKEARWHGWEEETLRSLYTQLLEQQGRYADLVEYLPTWVKENPEYRTAYEQYLSALIKSDQIEKANALASGWLKAGQVKGELPLAVGARLYAAVYLMLGNAHGLFTNRVEERWQAPLAQAVLFFARHQTEGSIAEQIMSHRQFPDTDEGRRVRKTIAGILTAEIGKLTAEQVQRFVRWMRPGDLEAEAWTKISAALRERWLNEAKAEPKHALGQALVTVLANHGTNDELLSFLRLQFEKGPEDRRVDYANHLFDRLLNFNQPWTAAIEDEAFTLLDKLTAAEEPGDRLFAAVAALHRLTDRMLEARYTARMKRIEHQEKLTRIELQKKKDENRRLAREGLADRLGKEAGKQAKALARWLTAERLYLDVSLDRNLKQAAAECWEQVGAAPPKAAKAPAEPSIERALDELLRQRYLITLANLAARKGAPPSLVERLLKYFDEGIAGDADGSRWKAFKYRLLVALDRPKELEKALAQWVRLDEGDNRWRSALGYLLAERGRIAEAIKQFEAVEAADELGPAAYRALAGWYMVHNQREQYERASVAVYRTTPEYRLYRSLAARLNPWQRRDGHLPTELDKEVLFMFAALFEKSSSPQSYLGQLREFYQACRDFRLLAVLADAVVGHTAARVYPFLQGMDSVLGEVRDEATADALIKHIGETRKRARTAVDRRALDLLEALVERRAAELQNQPGPYVKRALAALVGAFEHDWSPGEPRLMADFLAGMGHITQQPLAGEQLRQLKALYEKAEAGTIDRLHIGHRYASTLREHGSAAPAIDLLQTALKEFQEAQGGVLPVSANDALTSLVIFMEKAGHFGKGESVFLAQLQHPVHAQQRIWLTEQLYNLYHHALEEGGEVSLGAGRVLYAALHRKLQGDLPNAGQNHRYQLIELLCRVYRTAHYKKVPGVAADVKAFAFQAVPPILKQQVNNYDTLLANVAQTVHDLAGPRDGLAFLLDQIEAQPRWLIYNLQDGWSRHAQTLATWRPEVKKLGDLDGRLLKLVLRELRRDLETREARNRVMYHKHASPSHYWKEKEANFARTAEDVLAKRNQSGPSVQYLGEYFYWGLGHGKRAIEILLAAYKQKLLDEPGELQLVDYLHRENRHAESIPILQPLIERRPENLQYRVLLMHAYFRAGRQAELLALLKQTDTFFHQGERWTEAALAALAHSCLENELYEQSVAYSRELIPLHERNQPNRGVGNGTLAGYYVDLAEAYSGLKKTPEAVDAAAGGVVAWGPSHANRAQALETLKRVLVRSPDLDAFVAHFDKQKQDSAVIRKAIGQAYLAKEERAKAIVQLRIAAELQPNDAEIHQLLIAAYDQTKDKEGAIRQLLHAVQLSRRDIKLYQELGKRYTAAEQAGEAERAYTSIVEVLPTESESHALLAEIREKQNRWPEAIAHWKQVVHIRALEPTGLLKLAAAQIHEKQWDEARATLRQLNTRTWPTQFGDVAKEVRELEKRIGG
jgi:Flp pilus assembly protein TadD